MSALATVVVPPRAIVVPLNVAEPTASVLEKAVAPVAALVWVSAPVILTVPLKLRAAELVIVRVASFVATPDPTAPVNVTVPAAAFTMSVQAVVPAPSTAPPIVTPPKPAVRVDVTPVPIVRAPPPLHRLIRPFVVEIELESVVTPVVEKPEPELVSEIAPVAPLVNVPELVTATAPVEAVKLLLKS